MLEQALHALSVEEVVNGYPTGLSGVSIDSRQMSGNELFVAIQAERDGHNFIESALQHGAKAVLVSQSISSSITVPENVSIIRVTDTYQALRELANWFRMHVISSPVVAITGSHGKTSVRNFTSTILTELGDGLVPVRNFNNYLGVPLTMLQANAGQHFAVFELGMNHPGEIRDLTHLTIPDIGLITHIGRSHIEGLGSVENIASAKWELFDAMPASGTRIVNLDDPYLAAKAQSLQYENAVGYSLTNQTCGNLPVIHAEILASDGDANFGIIIDGVKMRSPLPGKHQCYNLLAAASIATVAGIPLSRIADRVQTTKPVNMRTQIVNVGGVRIIRDEYNASLASFQAALQLLDEITTAGKKIVIAGDIFELGEHSQTDHMKLGEMMAEHTVDSACFVGHWTKFSCIRYRALKKCADCEHVSTAQDAVQKMLDRIQPGDVVLVKGSRGMKLDIVSEAIINHVQTMIENAKA